MGKDAKVTYEAFLVKVVCPKGKITEAKRLLRGLNRKLPADFEIDEEYEGVRVTEDFYGEREFVLDPQIRNQIKR